MYIRNRFKEDPRVIVVKGCSFEILESYPDEYFDYVYLDGGHDYNTVHKDIQVLEKKVKNHGIIAFNDFTYFTMSDNYEYGVYRAVRELLGRTKHQVIGYCLSLRKLDDIIIRLEK